MDEPGDSSQRGAGAASGPAPAPDLIEAYRQISAAGRASAGAAGDAVNAFRTLLAADVALARSALGRAVAFISIGIVFGASAWLLFMAALIAFLSQHLHWPWLVSLLISAVLSLAVAGYGAWRAMYYYEHTRMRATRRQLARLGFGELADYTPDPGSPESTRVAAEKLAEQSEAKDGPLP